MNDSKLIEPEEELEAVGAKELVVDLKKAVFEDLGRFEVGDGPGAPEGNTNATSNNSDKNESVRIESPAKQGGNSSAYRAAKLKRDHP